MTTINNQALGVSFDLPEVYTVRLRLAVQARRGYDSISEDELYPRLWDAFAPLFSNWQCDCVKSPGQSLDEMNTARQAQIVQFAVLQANEYIRQADEVPKN